MKKTNNSLKCAYALILLCIITIIGLCSCELIMENKYGKPTYSKINILVYGNDYYYSPKYGSATARTLRCTINDATQVGLALEAWAKKEGIVYQSLYVTGKEYSKEGDHNTTKAHFRDLMSDLATKSKEGELTFIYFSCHGYNTIPYEVKKEYASTNQTAFVMCGNTGKSEECQLYWHSEFKEDLAQIKGAKVVFADICYSGGLVEPGNVSINTSEYNGMDALQLFWNTQVSELPDTFILTASRYYEMSYENPAYNHGLFTRALLSALDWDEDQQCLGDNTKDNITFFGLCRNVVESLSSYNKHQNPSLSDGSNDLILF